MDEGKSCSSGRVSLPHIRKLKLSGIDNDSLMHGGGVKASVHPLLPNVEILEVELCAGIKNLMAAAISFRNVTTLKVISCKGLVYLMTYAVAKSFVQLITMEVRSCERIVVIVGSPDADPDDAAPNEIIFSRLKRLTLSYLPSLRGFCSSGNCNVKIPSLTSLIVEFCSINFKISNGLLMNSRPSRISIMKNIMDELKNPNTMRIGIWGSGGVGKTTLAKKIYKQATLDKMLFDDVVILLDVKRNPNLEEIQKKIVEKLGMDILDNETVEKRASRLRARIKERKILVILDDVWKQIDLVAVGLPSVNTCKILLTSSIGKTLSDMNTQKEVLLDILEEKECWDLFQEKTGDAVLDDPAIRTVAKQVAENCGGLSVLVVIMASALKQITSLAAWEDALTCLKAKFDKGEELTEQARSGIKWSYNQLSDEELKPLFLLCGITTRGNYICLEDVLKYSMSLGFFSKANVGKARDVLHSQIKKLKDLCLLTDSSDNRYVRMPDLVRDVANQIAFRDQHILSLVEDGGNHELKELSDKNFLKKCTGMSFPSSKNIPMLLEVMCCPALRMFHLQGDLDADSQKISTRFFEEMKNLQVLSLQCMTIPSLPLSFHSLKNLSSLCLDKCRLGDLTLIGELSNLEILSLSESDVTHLPKELVGKLTHLRLLDLSDCSKLEMISPGFISSIGRLEELRMRNSFNKWEIEGKSTNASLSELNSCRLSALEIHILSADILPENFFSHNLERFNIILGDAYMWEKPMVETTLNTLKVKLTTSIEELSEGLKFLVKRSEDLSLYVEGMNNIVQSLDTQDFVHLKHLQLQSNVDFNHIINRKVVFPSLMTLRVHRCDHPSSLFSFSMPESHVELEHLQISTCKILEESQSSTREYSQENMDNVFSKQEDLKLNGSPNITRFCSRSRENLDIEGWVKLKAYDAAMSRNSKIWKLMEETHSEENNVDTIRHFLFDLKAVFQNLTTLIVDRCDHLSFLFSVDMIKSLVKLKHLEISICESIKEVVSSSENGEENMENVFPNLEILKLNELPNLTRFCSGSSIVFRSLKELDIQGCTKLGTFISENVAMSGKGTRIYEETEEKDSVGNYSSNTVHHSLFDEKIGLPKLTNLVVQKCNGLSFLSSVARSLEQLKDVLISECDIMKAILKEEIKDKIFPNLIQLKLDDLPSLNRFCSGSSVVFPLLKGLHIEKCTKLETFICNPLSNSSASLKETEERNTDQNIVTVIQDCLFDNKVGFPELATLTIIDLSKLIKSIWHTQLALDSFHKLQDVRVQKCDSLKTILPDSLIASVFQQLRNLIVEECGVENIVSQGLEDHLEFKRVFPNLIHLEFKSLSNLEKFYPGMPAFSWPHLKTLVLLNCKTLDIFAGEASGHQDTQVRHPSILIHQNIFNTLEDLTLVPNKICYGRPTSAVCCKKAVFAGISHRHPDRSLPPLRTLRLHGMEKFMRLWDIEPAGKEFQQLEILEVKFSGLNSLQLSSLFFENLTTLEVTFCWRLQYLTTYSVAQRLSQLKILKVDECKSMKEIFASEGTREDGSNGEIVFSQLQHLELSDLINLERFCSNKCTVKAPKLEKLDVNGYSIKLKSPSLEVDINMHLDVKKSHSSKKALNSTESALSSGNIQNQPATNASEGAEHIEVMDLNQKQIVTNTSKNLQEADFDMQENLIERLEEELRTKKADIRRLEEELRTKKADIRRLEEELRALKPEREREVNRALEDAHLCENPNREDHHLEVESKLSSNTINVKAKI